LGVFLINVGKISTILYNLEYKRILVVFILILVIVFPLIAGNADSVNIYNDSISQSFIDSSIYSLIKTDSTINDNIDSIAVDSLKLKKPKKSAFEEPVKYTAKDSFYFDIEKKKLYLYGNAQVNYQKIQLNAEHIEFDMSNETVYATGVKDSTGKLIGNPVFKEGSEQFDAHWLRYNFKTKKGFIYFVKTKEGDGTLIGDSTKREANGHISLKDATYSTCDLDHPHYYIGLTKAMAIPNDKIVSGPAYLVVADIPLPFIIPFGYFPNTNGAHSGFLMPTWGEDASRGFFLNRGGYYFAFNQYLDETITGDIYSKGSWTINSQTNYKLRYRYSGNFQFNYAHEVSSETGLPDYAVKSDYKLVWSHTQDAKANPNSSFNTSVNMSSASYDVNNSYTIGDRVTNTKNSNINYSYKWPNTPFSFSTSLTHSQNNINKTIDLGLPRISFNMNQIYPFRSEESSGDLKWWENITFQYRSDLSNNISTFDSIFLTKKTFDHRRFNNGFHQSAPLTANFKLGRFINITPSLNYDAVFYTKYIHKTFYLNSLNSSQGIDKIDTVYKPVYGQSIYPSISIGYNPKIYGMYLFKNSNIKAIRHVMSPSIGFSYVPDVSSIMHNNYYQYEQTNGAPKQYSIFDGSLYGTPQGGGRQSANITMALKNNFEMKYLDVNDTSSTEKKVSLLENLDFTGSYNLMADSNKLSVINMTTGTRLWHDKLNIQFGSVFDPYAINPAGKKTRYYDLEKNGQLARLVSATMSVGTSFSSSDGKGTTNTNPNQQQINQTNQNPTLNNNRSNQDVNFDIPWSLKFSYSWGYSKPGLKASLINSTSFSGDMSITKKWKVSAQSGYDFTGKRFNPTSFNLSRDLHCWIMTFYWVPFGTAKMYEFTINVKASILKDLKYTKKTDFHDNNN
jgi:lipopolysaccharide assembly outer membrane protein LptD (OstA)